MKFYTSIPLKISRIVDGQELGLIWTRMCIDSWRKAGYDVVSVNSASEAEQISSIYPDVKVQAVERDGMAAVGRPLIYLSDLLSVAMRDTCSHVAIANADVMFLNDAAVALKGWTPELGFAYSTRLDIDDLAGTNPRLHGGVDFIIIKIGDLQGIELPDFLFGTPWWDYWLPLVMNCKGVKGCRLAFNNLPVIAHLFHGDRWSHDDFLSNFSCFIAAISKVVDDRKKLSVDLSQVDVVTGLPGPMLKICLEYAKSSAGIIHKENSIFNYNRYTT